MYRVCCRQKREYTSVIICNSYHLYHRHHIIANESETNGYFIVFWCSFIYLYLLLIRKPLNERIITARLCIILAKVTVILIRALLVESTWCARVLWDPRKCRSGSLPEVPLDCRDHHSEDLINADGWHTGPSLARICPKELLAKYHTSGKMQRPDSTPSTRWQCPQHNNVQVRCAPISVVGYSRFCGGLAVHWRKTSLATEWTTICHIGTTWRGSYNISPLASSKCIAERDADECRAKARRTLNNSEESDLQR